MPRYKLYGLDYECYADIEIPECSYDVDKLEWTEVGKVYKRYASYIARTNGINIGQRDLFYKDYNSYFSKIKKQQLYYRETRTNSRSKRKNNKS